MNRKTFILEKHIVRCTAALFALCSLAGCSSDENNDSGIRPIEAQKSIVILYENDVHCAIDKYTNLAGLRDAITASDTAYVGIVSSGDFLNGDVSGAMSRGQYITDIMRNVGYDAITIGNHEFDFGVPRMQAILPRINVPVICANLFVAGTTKPMYPTFTIKNYGKKRIGFVGVCTPQSMRSEAYSFYDKEGHLLYDLRTNDVVALVQQSVDAARNAGADYVVLLSHLGENASDPWIDSHKLISQTKGIDVVLDGHTHSVIPHEEVANLDGKSIGVTQTGTQFANIGKLVITKDGKFSTSLIPIEEAKYTNQQVSATTDSIKKIMSIETDKVIGNSDFDLTINDSDGKRLVRKGETNLGDLCADAFREGVHADIGILNSGGIRNSIPAGTITFGKVYGVLPFYNLTCKIEVTGKMIEDFLKVCTDAYPKEDGAFPQIAGLKYTLHAVSHTITDVQVQNSQTGKYEPIEANRKYTIGTLDYYSSGGFHDTLKQATLIEMTEEQACNTLARHIKDFLGGNIPDTYRESQNRITIIND